jgi:hypothetical protein
MPSPTQRFNQKFWATRLNYHYSITSLLAYVIVQRRDQTKTPEKDICIKQTKKSAPPMQRQKERQKRKSKRQNAVPKIS